MQSIIRLMQRRPCRRSTETLITGHGMASVSYTHLWDCTSIAKELGILSESGRPHDKAVSAIVQKLDIFADEVVRTAYSRNGHDGVTVQYKDSVLEKVREWLSDNGYPTVIEFMLSNGNSNKCKVVYGEVA